MNSDSNEIPLTRDPNTVGKLTQEQEKEKDNELQKGNKRAFLDKYGAETYKSVYGIDDYEKFMETYGGRKTVKKRKTTKRRKTTKKRRSSRRRKTSKRR